MSSWYEPRRRLRKHDAWELFLMFMIGAVLAVVFLVLGSLQ